MKRSGSSTTSLTDMGMAPANADDKLNIFESGEEGTLDYRLRFAMQEHAHRCANVDRSLRSSVCQVMM